MTTQTSTHKIMVVLKLPRKVADFIIRATTVHDTVAVNAIKFPSLPLPLATFATHIATLSTAEAAAKTRATGAVADRNTARTQVVVDLDQYQGYVQVLCNLDPTHADVIAQDAGMTLRKQAVRAKSDLAVKSVQAGAVKLVAKALKGAKTYDWQYSTDGGKTWQSAPSSTKASTTITGLQAGVVVSYRHRAVTKAGPQDWGQAISDMVV